MYGVEILCLRPLDDRPGFVKAIEANKGAGQVQIGVDFIRNEANGLRASATPFSNCPVAT